MAHMIDRCDILDLLEESVVTKRAVHVQLQGGKEFTDLVRDVVTEAGEDFADFQQHGRVPVRDIRSSGRAEPRDSSYAGKAIRQNAAGEDTESEQANPRVAAGPAADVSSRR